VADAWFLHNQADFTALSDGSKGVSIDNANHKKEKTVIGALLFVGMATLILGFLNINKSIYAPFSQDRNFHIKTPEELEQERVQKLKETDSDKDTINDYDELYVFRTSPFLEDSDSDGVPDNKEIAMGTDPTCAQGKTCRQARTTNTPQQSAFVSGQFDNNVAAMNTAEQRASALAAEAGKAGAGTVASEPVTAPPAKSDVVETTEDMNRLITETFGDVSKLSSEQFKAKVEGLSSLQMRQFMARLGIPKETLDKAGDVTLREIINEALGEAMKSYSN
jgi:hypothetical protein